MKRPVIVLVLSLVMSPSLSANLGLGKVLFLAAEVAVERMPDLLKKTIARPRLSPQEQLDEYYRAVSVKEWLGKKENLQLLVASRHTALRRLGLPDGTTVNVLVAKLESLPITDRQHQELRQQLVSFFNNSDASSGFLSHDVMDHHFRILRNLSMRYGDNEKIVFPCPGCGTEDFRPILNSEIERIAKEKIPQEEVELGKHS